MATLALALTSCSQKAPAPKAPDHADDATHAGHSHSDHAGHGAPPPAPVADPSAPTGPRVETGSFLLEVSSPESGLTVGTPGQVTIALEGRGDWHVNQEYPIRVDLKAAPGVGLQQQALEKSDAEVFNDDKATFLASLEPVEAGEHEVICDVRFALCTDENCVLERRTVAMHVKVE